MDIHCQVPSPTLITTASLASSSLKMGMFIFIHVSSQCLLPNLEHLDPSEQSDWDDIEDAMDIELLSLLNPWSGEGEGNLGD